MRRFNFVEGLYRPQQANTQLLDLRRRVQRTERAKFRLNPSPIEDAVDDAVRRVARGRLFVLPDGTTVPTSFYRRYLNAKITPAQFEVTVRVR